jgi:hypothetical protein
MFGFFNTSQQQEKPTDLGGWLYQRMPSPQAIAYYNGAVVAIAVYHLINHPEASYSECGSDILIHLMSATISDQSSFWGLSTSVFLNLHRMTSIIEHLVVGDSSLPFAINVLDLLISHPLNVYQVLEIVLGSTLRTHSTRQKSNENRPFNAAKEEDGYYSADDRPKSLL